MLGKICLSILSALLLSACQGIPYSLSERNVLYFADTETAVIKTTNFEGNLIFHKPDPSEYKLVRDSYELHFYINLRDAGPVYIKLKGNNNKTIKIDLTPFYIDFWKKTGCNYIEFKESIRDRQVIRKDIYKFNWMAHHTDFNNQKCGYPKKKNENTFIAFEVLNQDNEILGVEKIPFFFKHNGYYINYLFI